MKTIKVKAIVYTSNTGYTAEYAKLFHDATNLPIFSLEDARKKLSGGYKVGMMIMSKILKKKLGGSEISEDNKRIIDMLENGGSCVSLKNLEKVISAICGQ